MGRLVCLPESDLDRNAVTVSFRQVLVNHPAKCAGGAVLFVASRNGCERVLGSAEGLAAGAEPFSGLVVPSRPRRKFFRYRSLTRHRNLSTITSVRTPYVLKI